MTVNYIKQIIAGINKSSNIIWKHYYTRNASNEFLNVVPNYNLCDIMLYRLNYKHNQTVVLFKVKKSVILNMLLL